MIGAVELAKLLDRAADGPIETGGATVLLEAISGGRVTADVSISPAARVTAEEKSLLNVHDHDDLHLRAGMLRCQRDIPIAEVTTLIVNARIPGQARASLGLTPSGQLMASPSSVPLGRALSGYGIRREQHPVMLTPTCRADSGALLALRSSALLRSADGVPLAWVVERIYSRFIEKFPPPWQGLPRAAGERAA